MFWGRKRTRAEIIKKSFYDESQDVLRGVSGGIIFGTPLLYTMEMWFHGMYFSPQHLLSILAFVFFVNLTFSHASGLRSHNDHSFFSAVADTITALGVAIIVSTFILALIGRLGVEEGLDSMLGKVLIEAGVISIGITFTNSKFPRDKSAGEDDPSQKKLKYASLSPEKKQALTDLATLAAIIGGAVVFSSNVAPTEEIVLIASALTPVSLIILLLSEIVICYMILFISNLKHHTIYKPGLLQKPASEVVMTVSVSLLIAAALLFLVGESQATENISSLIACIIVLGFPASVGGAAGRLAI